MLALHDIVMPADKKKKKVTFVLLPKASFVDKVALWIWKSLQLK